MLSFNGRSRSYGRSMAQSGKAGFDLSHDLSFFVSERTINGGYSGPYLKGTDRAAGTVANPFPARAALSAGMRAVSISPRKSECAASSGSSDPIGLNWRSILPVLTPT